MGGILGLLLSAAIAMAAQSPLNPKLGFTAVNPAWEGRPGVLRAYKAERGDAYLKSIPIADSSAAARAMEVSISLIKGLYQPKKNPYAGEVTSLVRCDSRFSPKEFSVPCPSGGKVKAIGGGTGVRNAFGMCRKEDIERIGVFFTCFDEGKKELTEVRLFVPFDNAKSWSTQLKEAEKLAQELLL